MKREILPRENEKDQRELPDHVLRSLEFIPVEHLDEVLAAAIPEVAEASNVAVPSPS
jgi:ATP-dependent Lon protease